MKDTVEHNKKGKTQEGDTQVEDIAENSKNRGQQQGDTHLEDTAENSKIEDTAGRYTLGGHSREF